MSNDRIPLRVKNSEDCMDAAERINEETDIDPWSVEQVSDLIFSSRRVHGLPLDTGSKTPVISVPDLLDWFENRILQTTVELTWDDYEEALGMGLYDILVSGLDPTDMGGLRQRSLAQHLENALTGYLAEVAVANFLEDGYLESANLDLGRTGTLDEMVGSDIATISKEGEERPPNLDIQIKKSKPRSSWLPVPEKGDTPPDVFVLSLVGPHYEHLLQYLDSLGVLDQMTYSLSNEKRGEVRNQLSDPGPIPVHISGFIYWSDLESGELRIEKKRKRAHIEGGAGEIPEKVPGYGTPKVAGLENPSENYIAATSALRYSQQEWKQLVSSL